MPILQQQELVLQWYNVSSGGSPLAGTTALTTGTYYVSQTVSGCESVKTSVTVTITITALPTATSPQIFCSNTKSVQLLILQQQELVLQWYNVSTGSSPTSGNNSAYIRNILCKSNSKRM